MDQVKENDNDAGSWRAYPSIFALGHKALANLFDGPVLVEEKIDGSQISFGLFGDGLRIRSKNKSMLVDAPEKLFQKAVDSVLARLPSLHPGWTYRAEYLSKPKHNTLCYGRVPTGYLMLFDINTGNEAYLSSQNKAAEAIRIGLEMVPTIYEGVSIAKSQIQAYLERESCLGNTKVEGVVIKNYTQFGIDQKVLMGKYVSEVFKERNAKGWRLSNPRSADVVQRLILEYRTEARWQKALQHLTEAGRIEGSPRDIGLLVREVWPDIEKECIEEIKEALYKWAKDKLQRGVTAGVAEWYKRVLLDKQFDGSN